MVFSILTCYYFWLENEKKLSLREPGKSQAERAVLGELCQAAQSGWVSRFEGACPSWCPLLGLIPEHI